MAYKVTQGTSIFSMTLRKLEDFTVLVTVTQGNKLTQLKTFGECVLIRIYITEKRCVEDEQFQPENIKESVS